MPWCLQPAVLSAGVGLMGRLHPRVWVRCSLCILALLQSRVLFWAGAGSGQDSCSRVLHPSLIFHMCYGGGCLSVGGRGESEILSC